MAEIKADPEAQRTVFQARARQMGVTPEAMTAMNATALSEPPGQAIHMIHAGDTANRLWEVYAAFTAAEARYLRRYISASVHAKTAKLEAMPEVFETRDDQSPDLRDADERDRDAITAWARWRDHLAGIPRHHQSIIFDVAYARVEPVRNGRVTQRGRLFVAAIEALADRVDQTNGTV